MLQNFEHFISGLTVTFTPVLDAALRQEDYIAIDLSTANQELGMIEQDSSAGFTQFMEHYLERTGKKVAFGGYKELRGLYGRHRLFTDFGHPRNIHIGLDLWAPRDTAVLAVLAGTVHSFQDNAAPGDYGPTIILEHIIEGQKFYTLYGHLNRFSLAGLRPGKIFGNGEKLGELGGPVENGDYAPHLHFQIIGSMEGKIGDFPGVTTAKDLTEVLQNCPDPEGLLKIRS